MSARLPCLLATIVAAAIPVAATQIEERCVTDPSFLVELELTGCRPADLAIEEQISGTRVWWLRPYMLSIAETNPGVMVRGRVARRLLFENFQPNGSWREDGLEEEIFYPSLDGQLCEAFEDVERGLFLVEPPCCEIIPPASVACLLETDEMRPVPPRVLELLEELEDAEDAVDEEG